jgi:hypothetical protein
LKIKNFMKSKRVRNNNKGVLSIKIYIPNSKFIYKFYFLLLFMKMNLFKWE